MRPVFFKNRSFNGPPPDQKLTKKQTRSKVETYCATAFTEPLFKWKREGKEKRRQNDYRACSCMLFVSAATRVARLNSTNNWMAGQRPGAAQGKQCPLYTWGHTHKEDTQGMHVGQRGHRHEECSIGIKWWREDRSDVRCSDLSPTLMP